MITTHPAINLSFTLTNHYKIPQHSSSRASLSLIPPGPLPLSARSITFQPFLCCFMVSGFSFLFSESFHSTSPSCGGLISSTYIFPFPIYPCAKLFPSKEPFVNQYSQQIVNPPSPSSQKSLLPTTSKMLHRLLSVSLGLYPARSNPQYIHRNEALSP